MKHFNSPSESNVERKTGIEWLRERLTGKYGMCENHNHLECLSCGTTKCVGSDYDQYDVTDQQCDCDGVTDHIVVPFDDFGQYVGFP